MRTCTIQLHVNCPADYSEGQTTISYLTRPLSSRFKSSSLRSTWRMAASSSADRKLKSINSSALFDCFILVNKTNAFQQQRTFPQGKLPTNSRVYLKSEICQPTFNPYESANAQVTSTPSEMFSEGLRKRVAATLMRVSQSFTFTQCKKKKSTTWRHLSTFSLRIKLMFLYPCPSGVT